MFIKNDKSCRRGSLVNGSNKFRHSTDLCRKKYKRIKIEKKKKKIENLFPFLFAFSSRSFFSVSFYWFTRATLYYHFCYKIKMQKGYTLNLHILYILELFRSISPMPLFFLFLYKKREKHKFNYKRKINKIDQEKKEGIKCI